MLDHGDAVAAQATRRAEWRADVERQTRAGISAKKDAKCCSSAASLVGTARSPKAWVSGGLTGGDAGFGGGHTPDVIVYLCPLLPFWLGHHMAKPKTANGSVKEAPVSLSYKIRPLQMHSMLRVTRRQGKYGQ